jgi:antitoxin MazE
MIQPTSDRITLKPDDSGHLTLTIPSSITNAMQITVDSEITFEVINGTLILRPQEKTEYTLEELLAGITPENCHGEMDWGTPVGQEQW